MVSSTGRTGPGRTGQETSRTSRLVLRLALICLHLSLVAGLATLGSPALAQDGSLAPSPRQRTAPADLPPEEAMIVRLYDQTISTVVSVFGETSREDGDVVETTRSHGSGVLVDAERVLTAAHVVVDRHRVLVRAQDGIERPAFIVAIDHDADLALLRLPTPVPGAAAAALGDSDQLAVGQRVIAIGNPFGLENSLSVGRVSGFRQTITSSEAERTPGYVAPEYIQTDAAINSGNSGGPLFDSAGRVMGIASKFWSISGGSEGVGFAVTINTAKRLLEARQEQVVFGRPETTSDARDVEILATRKGPAAPIE